MGVPVTIQNNVNGTLAEVTNYGQLAVRSESMEEEQVAAIRGQAYIFHGECHLANASSGGLCYIHNTSQTESIAITRIYFDAHTLSGTIKLLQVKEPTTVSNGTDVSSTGIIQKNFGAADDLSATFVISDSSSDMTYSGGEQFHAFALKSEESKPRDMHGTNILLPNTKWLIGWSTAGVGGGNATNGETIGISINALKFKLSEYGG